MLTTKKEDFIISLRNQVMRDIPVLDEEDLLMLEKGYLYLNVYEYLTELSVDQIRALKPLMKAALRIIKKRGRVPLPRFLDEYLFTIGDALTPLLQNYANLLKQVIETPLKQLRFGLNTYLVYLIETHNKNHSNVLGTMTNKIRLGTYLNHYIESRKATDNTIDGIDLNDLHRDTYRANLQINNQYNAEILEDILAFQDFVECNLELLINPQNRINNGFYWDHRQRP